MIKYRNDSICISITFMDQSVSLNREIITVKPAHNRQIRSQTKSTVRSRWPLRATVTFFFFMDRRKKKDEYTMKAFPS